MTTRRQCLALLGASAGHVCLQAKPFSSATPQVGFIYVGPIGDGGWTYAHDQGRRVAEHNLPGRFESIVVERVPESNAAEAVLQRLISMGVELIFATAFGYRDSILRLAPLHPNVRFEHCTGFDKRVNIANYDVRRYEACYLAGLIAGEVSLTGKVGVVGAIPIPEVIRNINAFAIGAREVNPQCRVQLEWVNSYFAPDLERQATNVLIDGGADVLLQTTDSPTVLQQAQERGARAFGMDSDMTLYAPKAHLGSAASVWGTYYTQRIQEYLDGRWRQGDTWIGMREGAVDLVGVPEYLPKRVHSRLQARKLELKFASHQVFGSPLRDTHGKVAIKSWTTDQQLQAMNFLVEGVIGRLPR